MKQIKEVRVFLNNTNQGDNGKYTNRKRIPCDELAYKWKFPAHAVLLGRRLK